MVSTDWRLFSQTLCFTCSLGTPVSSLTSSLSLLETWNCPHNVNGRSMRINVCLCGTELWWTGALVQSLLCLLANMQAGIGSGHTALHHYHYFHEPNTKSSLKIRRDFSHTESLQSIKSELKTALRSLTFTKLYCRTHYPSTAVRKLVKGKISSTKHNKGALN